MKRYFQKIRWLSCVALAGILCAHVPLFAQDTTDTAPASNDENKGPKPVIYKAGERVEATWGSSSYSWYGCTIVSNLGGGEYLIRWDDTQRTETKQVTQIRKPEPRPSRSYRSSSSSDAPAPPVKTKVGNKVTWSANGKTFSGTITAIENADVVRVKLDEKNTEKLLPIRDILSQEYPAPATPAAPKASGTAAETGAAGPAAVNSSVKITVAPKPEDPDTGAYKVGNKVTWKVADQTFTGFITSIIDDTTLKVLPDGQDTERMLDTRKVLSRQLGSASKDAPTADSGRSYSSSSRDSSLVHPGTFLFKQKIYYRYGSEQKAATVILDKGARVVALPEDYTSTRDIYREEIITAPASRSTPPGISRADFSECLDLQIWKSQSKFILGGATLATAPKNQRIKIENPGPAGEPARPVQQLFVSPTQPIGFVTFAPADNQPGLMTRYNLETGLATANIKFPDAGQILDISPDSHRAATLANGKVTIWALTEPQPTKTLTFEPFGAGSSFNPASDKIYLFGDNCALTVSPDNHLAISWQLTTGVAKAFWASTEQNTEYSLGPQRTWVLVSGWSYATLVDLRSGQYFWRGSDLGQAVATAFSTDCQRIAVVRKGESKIHIVNTLLQEQPLEQTIPFQACGLDDGTVPDMQWVSPNTLLLNNRYLYALKSKAIAWQFTNPIPFTATGPGIGWAIKKDPQSGPVLASTYILDDNVLGAIAQTSPKSIAILLKGDSISVNFSIQGGPPDIAVEARKKVEQYLKDSGLKIDPFSETKLFLTSTVGPLKTSVINREINTRNNKPQQTVTYAPISHKAEITQAGKTVWTSTSDYKGPDPDKWYAVHGDQVNELFTTEANESYNWLKTFAPPIPLYKSLKDWNLGASPLFP